MAKLAGFFAVLVLVLFTVVSEAAVAKDHRHSLTVLELNKTSDQVVANPKPSNEKLAAPAYFSGFGICYSPFRADRTCKSQQDIDYDIWRLRHYSLVRIYGVDCNQVSMVLRAAKAQNLKVWAGIWDLNNFDGQLDHLINSARDSWSHIVAINIGNELVNRGANSPDQVLGAINHARGRLRGAGYGGPVVTVDTVNVLTQHPKLCKETEFCAANAHAFFSRDTAAHEAGPFARDQADMVSRAADWKHTIITESGWPSGGWPNGRAVPSPRNQEIAVQSLRDSFRGRDGSLLLFSAFDDKWKDDFEGSFGTEKFWGIED